MEILYCLRVGNDEIVYKIFSVNKLLVFLANECGGSLVIQFERCESSI